MADSVLTKQTTLSGEEVVTRAIQFFSTENWRTTSQSPRAATFEGRPRIPWFLMLLNIVGYMCCIVPGIVIKIIIIKKMRRFQNLVVAVTPMNTGTEVIVTHPDHAKKLAKRFLAALPELTAP
ncbi:MAG: hypothetical protein ABSF34_17200 [Verrucomicrobiota bacterium]